MPSSQLSLDEHVMGIIGADDFDELPKDVQKVLRRMLAQRASGRVYDNVEQPDTKTDSTTGTKQTDTPSTQISKEADGSQHNPKPLTDDEFLPWTMVPTHPKAADVGSENGSAPGPSTSQYVQPSRTDSEAGSDVGNPDGLGRSTPRYMPTKSENSEAGATAKPSHVSPAFPTLNRLSQASQFNNRARARGTSSRGGLNRASSRALPSSTPDHPSHPASTRSWPRPSYEALRSYIVADLAPMSSYMWPNDVWSSSELNDQDLVELFHADREFFNRLSKFWKDIVDLENSLNKIAWRALTQVDEWNLEPPEFMRKSFERLQELTERSKAAKTLDDRLRKLRLVSPVMD